MNQKLPSHSFNPFTLCSFQTLGDVETPLCGRRPNRLSAAHLVIVLQLFYLWLAVAQRTLTVSRNLKQPELCFEGIVDQKLTDQGFPYS